MMENVRWFAAGGGIRRMGPFMSQAAAWAALRLTSKEADRQRSEHPADTRVWPEEEA